MPMASADLSRRVQKVVAYPPLSDIAAASVASSTKRCSTPTASKTSLASGRGRSSTQSRTGRSCGLSRTPSPLAPSRDRRARRDRCLSVSDGLAGPNLGQGRPRASDLDELPPRIDTPLLFPAPHGGLLNLDNFRRREWAPAIEAAAIARPARIYDLRSTFASNAIAASIDVFELARVMGTSIEMIERHYGTLLSGAAAGIASRLAAFEAEQEQTMELERRS
jgi:hypothetical protein